MKLFIFQGLSFLICKNLEKFTLEMLRGARASRAPGLRWTFSSSPVQELVHHCRICINWQAPIHQYFTVILEA
jgi:hypothetical protein